MSNRFQLTTGPTDAGTVAELYPAGDLPWRWRPGCQICCGADPDLKTQPVKGRNGETRVRALLDIGGKGAKNRVVPISDSSANVLQQSSEALGGAGYVARSLGMNGEPCERLSGQGVFEIVQKRGKLIGKEYLQPHDLRRTYAQLGYEAEVPITQISRLLGHASIETTQRYLNLELDLESTVSDFTPFG